MQIQGAIEEIVFRNDENGYTVALLSYNKTPVTIVGKMISANIGENLILEGEFVHNKKFGYQFAFTSYEITLPQTLVGIEKYLSSGLIKGVGPVLAKNIVQKFKEDTFSVIEMAPEKLAEVRGISKNKAYEISAKFFELRSIQNAIMFLQGYDISVNMALKIFEIYGSKTVEIVRNNPYRLVEDIDGIGFLTADKIAKNLGIAMESVFRVRAGIVHCLAISTEKNGNTFLPKGLLFSNTMELLGFQEEKREVFDEVIDELVSDKTCMHFWHDNLEIIILTKYYRYEYSVAQKLCLLASAVNVVETDISNEIKSFEERNNVIFHVDQKRAIECAVNNGVSVITGGPGTGKTTIVKCIIDILANRRESVLLLAPTGRAAKRLSDSTGQEAKTIHRALEVNGDIDRIGRFVHNENNPFDIKNFIVDEVSMVDVMLMSLLLKALPRDARLILVGDKDQLPSVGAGNVLGDILASNCFPVTMLTKIYRQTDDSLIISNAQLINNGVMPVIDNNSRDFFFEQKSDLNEIHSSIVEMVTKRIPNFLSIDPSQIQVLAPLKAGVCGVDNLNRTLQDILNPASSNKNELVLGTTIFREGDKVMQTSNDYNLKWSRRNGFLYESGEGVFNGDIGQIQSIDFQTGETIVEFEDGRVCTYARTDIGELSLAYAITIHKSQGSEFDVVVIPVIAGTSMILTRNLIYTAVTRAKKMVVLVGEKKNLRRMVANSYTVKRFTLLKKLLIEQNEKIKELFE